MDGGGRDIQPPPPPPPLRYSLYEFYIGLVAERAYISLEKRVTLQAHHLYETLPISEKVGTRCRSPSYERFLE